ncbi:MAG TPA: efflux transporter outer membrane subunit [Crenalkalicoccus sp.]|nr:efflux transporter outer membrane subunit [Crenalkalicoccus sp.]
MPRGPTRPLILLLGLLLGGCAWLTPAATSSGIALPDRLRHAAAAPADWPNPEWWRGFGAPELDALMQQAVAANYNIAIAIARIRQADAQVRISGAALLPLVNLVGQSVRQQSGSTTSASIAGLTARSTRVRVSSSNAVNLQASYEIDFWGKNRAVLEQAQQTAAANRFDLGAVALTTEASVANTYFALLAAQAQLAIQRSNLQIAEHVLGVIRNRQAVGTATGLDFAQQATVVAQQRALIPPLIQSAEQNRDALAVLVARPPESITVAGGGFDAIDVPPVAAGLPAEVLARRPDVLFAEANLAAANANVVVARAQLLPSITLTGSGGFSSLALETLLRPSSQIFTLTAGLVQPIFHGGQLRGQIELSEAQAEELLATYRLSIVSALQDVEDALVALRQTTEQEQLQAEAVRSAERANAIAEAQLSAGTIDLITLLNTQQTLFNARNTLVTVRLNRLQAAVGLFRALGGGWGDVPA